MSSVAVRRARDAAPCNPSPQCFALHSAFFSPVGRGYVPGTVSYTHLNETWTFYAS
jgi:hypothetical protein